MTANLLLRHGDVLLEDSPDDGLQQGGSSQRTIVVEESAVLCVKSFQIYLFQTNIYVHINRISHLARIWLDLSLRQSQQSEQFE